MQKRSLLLFALLILLPFTTAFTTTETEVSDTLSTISISTATNLYAYEINLDYGGTISSVSHHNFLGPTTQATYGSSQRNNILSVYGSIQNSTHPGVSGSGNLFNVTHSGDLSLRYTLAVYADGTEEYTYYNGSSEDNIESGTGGPGSGAGGGGSEQFSVSPSLIKTAVTQGETVTEILTIKNNLNTILSVSAIPAENLKRFIALDEEEVTLLPQETKAIGVNFFARNNEVPEVYAGVINFEGDGTTKKVSTIVEVKEKEPLFDVVVDLERNEYSAGDKAIAVVEVENFGQMRNIDVALYCAIKDFNGDVIAFQENYYAIENYKLQIICKLKIPENQAPGDYIFYARANYGNIIATGSEGFSVDNARLSPFSEGNVFLYSILILVAIIIIVTIILFFTTRKKIQPRPQQENIKT